MRPMTLEMGRKKFEFDLDDFSLRTRNKLIQEINKISESHHPLVKWPRQKVQDKNEAGEDVERDEDDKEWRKRVLEQVASELSKRDDESEKEYEDRVFKASMSDDVSQIAYEILQVIGRLVDVEAPKQEVFEEASWTAIREVMFTTLSELNIPLANTFRPI